MEQTEKYLQMFTEEGFVSVFEWTDPAGTVYEQHVHKGRVSIMVLEGSINFDFEGVKKDVQAGERVDIEPGTLHAAIVGPNGWKVVVGEEIAGDS